jgi:hypothetical protein
LCFYARPHPDILHQEKEKLLAGSGFACRRPAKLKEPVTVDRKFEDVVRSAQDAAVLVLVY